MLVCPPPLLPQFPGTTRPCLANPIPAGEATQPEPETPQSDEREVVIESVNFEGAPPLPATILDDLAAFVKQHYVGDGPIPIKELDGYETEVIRGFLQERGYFTVKVRAHAQFLGSDAANERYSLTARISDTRQFWLADLQFRGADPNSLVSPPAQLREVIPLEKGDVFNIMKIRDGIGALHKFYASHGYINSVVTPDFHIDGDRQLVSIVLELDIGSQFRVGNVEVLGLDTSVESLLRSKLIPGDIYNPHVVYDFFKENQSLLPVGASLMNLDVCNNDAKGTVDLRFDFTPCPKTLNSTPSPPGPRLRRSD